MTEEQEQNLITLWQNDHPFCISYMYFANLSCYVGIQVCCGHPMSPMGQRGLDDNERCYDNCRRLKKMLLSLDNSKEHDQVKWDQPF